MYVSISTQSSPFSILCRTGRSTLNADKECADDGHPQPLQKSGSFGLLTNLRQAQVFLCGLQFRINTVIFPAASTITILPGCSLAPIVANVLGCFPDSHLSKVPAIKLRVTFGTITSRASADVAAFGTRIKLCPASHPIPFLLPI